MRIFRLESTDGVGFVFGKMKYYLPIELEYDYVYTDVKNKNGTRVERRQHPDADVGTPLACAFMNKQIYIGSPIIFGFSNVSDLYSWISPAYLGVYELNGYYIHIYDVPDEYVISGSRQVAFDPAHSVKKIKISHKQLRTIK